MEIGNEGKYKMHLINYGKNKIPKNYMWAIHSQRN
jgi:hypothetical protein